MGSFTSKHLIGVQLHDRQREDSLQTRRFLSLGRNAAVDSSLAEPRRSSGVVRSAAQGGTCEGGWEKHVGRIKKHAGVGYSNLITANILSALVAFL